MKKSTLKPFSRSKDNQAFFNTLNERVSKYFKEKNISKTGNIKMYIKTFIMVSLYLGTYGLLFVFPFNLWFQLLLCIVIGIGMAGVGMNVMHDGNHSAYSSKKWVNKLMGSTMYLLSGNARNWRIHHNMLHHTYTNVYGYDNDLDAGRVMRFSEHSKWYWLHKYQHFYSLFTYGLMTLNWLITTDITQSINYARNGFYGKDFNKVKHWVKLILFKIIYWFVWIVTPMLFLDNSWWQILIGFLLIHYTAGFVLSFIFQLAHIVEDAKTITPDSKDLENSSWAMHQLYTTTNFGTNNTLLNWYTGGLNHQIEHHLFPSICHIHYTKISGIVKKTAREFNLPYYEYKTMWKAVTLHIKHLKTLSKNPSNYA